MSEARHCPRCGATLPGERSAERLCRACLLELALEEPPPGVASRGESAADADALEDLAHGSEIGPYTVVDRLGEGGMGVVYLAEQTEPIRRRVALKVIKRGMDTRRVIARFEIEKQTLALMDHPAIARVLDAGMTPDGRPFFVMDLVEGEPLTTYCDRTRRSTRERLELLTRVCDAVQHAHQKGIIHRDIKPSNVLVVERDGQPRPVIIDFGIARAIDRRGLEASLFTELGVLIGTPEYMSPEQADLNAFDVDTRTDVYSLGVLLYELLTGALPHDPAELRGAALDEIRRRIREEDPPTPSSRLSTLGSRSTEFAQLRRVDVDSLRRQIAGDLDWIALRALARDPDRRYPTPSELAADLRRHLNDQPVEAGPPGAAYRVGKFFRRHRILVLSAGTVALALIAGAALATLFAFREARQRDEAERARADLEATAAFQAGMLGDVDPQGMGERLAQDLRSRGIAAGSDGASFDRFVGPVNTTDVALQAIDEEILARAADSAAEQFADRPLILARLLESIGRTYSDLGLLERAEPHLRRAIELREAELGRRHPDTLASLGQLGTLLRRTGRLEQAEAVLVEAADGQRQALGTADVRTLDALNSLAMLYKDTGNYERAAALHLETLESARATLGDDHPRTLTSRNNLATVYEDLGRYDEAEAIYRETLDARRRVLGDDHPETLTSMSNLVSLYKNRGRFAEGQVLAAEALAIRRRVLGNEHPDTLVSIGVLASLWLDLGRSEEALELAEEGVSTLRSSLGEEHPSTMTARSNLASMLTSLGRYAEAEAIDRDVLDIRRRVLGREHPHTLVSISNLGVLLANTGRFEEAEELLSEVVATRRRVLGPDHPSTLRSTLSLGYVEAALGRFDDAERRLVECVDLSGKALGADHPVTLTARTNLATVLMKQERYTEAEALLAEISELRDKALGADHPESIGLRARIGQSQLGQSRLDEAEATLRSAVEAMRRTSADPRMFGMTLDLLGDCLTRLERYDEAEPVLLESHERLSAALGPEHRDTRKTESDLRALYRAWGREEQAAAWRAGEAD